MKKQTTVNQGEGNTEAAERFNKAETAFVGSARGKKRIRTGGLSPARRAGGPRTGGTAGHGTRQRLACTRLGSSWWPTFRPVRCTSGRLRCRSPIAHTASKSGPKEASPLLSRKAEKHGQGTIQSDNILFIQCSDSLSQPRLRNRRDLVDHQPAGDRQAISITGLNQHQKQQCLC